MSNRKKAGVVGWPVSHSLSPLMHNYWLERYKINAEYKAYPVEPESLPEFIENLHKDKDFAGVNLTIPHKEKVMALLDEVDDLAKVIGAVNTVINDNGKLRGTNTDAYGFAENIRPHIKGTKKAIIFGAGGAARAVSKALLDLEFSNIIITNRTLAKADNISQQFDNKLEVVSWEECNAFFTDADLLVNTTSLGMTGKESLDVDLSLLPKTALVTDIVYNPLITTLLKQARERGNPTVDGLGMLIHQGAEAFKEWFGILPEVTEELKQKLQNALSGK